LLFQHISLFRDTSRDEPFLFAVAGNVACTTAHVTQDLISHDRFSFTQITQTTTTTTTNETKTI